VVQLQPPLVSHAVPVAWARRPSFHFDGPLHAAELEAAYTGVESATLSSRDFVTADDSAVRGHHDHDAGGATPSRGSAAATASAAGVKVDVPAAGAEVFVAPEDASRYAATLRDVFRRHTARLDIHDGGKDTALHWACCNNHPAALAVVLRAWAAAPPGLPSANAVHNVDGGAPLHAAAVNGRREALAVLLLWPGTDANVRFARTARQSSTRRETAGHIVAAHGRTACLDLLLQAGADLSVVSHGGRTALHEAVRTRNAACSEMILLSSGLSASRTDLSIADDTGRTALCSLIPRAKVPVLVLPDAPPAVTSPERTEWLRRLLQGAASGGEALLGCFAHGYEDVLRWALCTNPATAALYPPTVPAGTPAGTPSSLLPPTGSIAFVAALSSSPLHLPMPVALLSHWATSRCRVFNAALQVQAQLRAAEGLEADAWQQGRPAAAAASGGGFFPALEGPSVFARLQMLMTLAFAQLTACSAFASGALYAARASNVQAPAGISFASILQRLGGVFSPSLMQAPFSLPEALRRPVGPYRTPSGFGGGASVLSPAHSHLRRASPISPSASQAPRAQPQAGSGVARFGIERDGSTAPLPLPGGRSTRSGGVLLSGSTTGSGGMHTLIDGVSPPVLMRPPSELKASPSAGPVLGGGLAKASASSMWDSAGAGEVQVSCPFIPDLGDVTLVTAEGWLVRVHSLVLAARCPSLWSVLAPQAAACGSPTGSPHLWSHHSAASAASSPIAYALSVSSPGQHGQLSVATGAAAGAAHPGMYASPSSRWDRGHLPQASAALPARVPSHIDGQVLLPLLEFCYNGWLAGESWCPASSEEGADAAAALASAFGDVPRPRMSCAAACSLAETAESFGLTTLADLAVGIAAQHLSLQELPAVFEWASQQVQLHTPPPLASRNNNPTDAASGSGNASTPTADHHASATTPRSGAAVAPSSSAVQSVATGSSGGATPRRGKGAGLSSKDLKQLYYGAQSSPLQRARHLQLACVDFLAHPAVGKQLTELLQGQWEEHRWDAGSADAAEQQRAAASLLFARTDHRQRNPGVSVLNSVEAFDTARGEWPAATPARPATAAGPPPGRLHTAAGAAAAMLVSPSRAMAWQDASIGLGGEMAISPLAATPAHSNAALRGSNGRATLSPVPQPEPQGNHDTVGAAAPSRALGGGLNVLPASASDEAAGGGPLHDWPAALDATGGRIARLLEDRLLAASGQRPHGSGPAAASSSSSDGGGGEDDDDARSDDSASGSSSATDDAQGPEVFAEDSPYPAQQFAAHSGSSPVADDGSTFSRPHGRDSAAGALAAAECPPVSASTPSYRALAAPRVSVTNSLATDPTWGQRLDGEQLPPQRPTRAWLAGPTSAGETPTAVPGVDTPGASPAVDAGRAAPTAPAHQHAVRLLTSGDAVAAMPAASPAHGRQRTLSPLATAPVRGASASAAGGPGVLPAAGSYVFAAPALRGNGSGTPGLDGSVAVSPAGGAIVCRFGAGLASSPLSSSGASAAGRLGRGATTLPLRTDGPQAPGAAATAVTTLTTGAPASSPLSAGGRSHVELASEVLVAASDLVGPRHTFVLHAASELGPDAPAALANRLEPGNWRQLPGPAPRIPSLTGRSRLLSVASGDTSVRHVLEPFAGILHFLLHCDFLKEREAQMAALADEVWWQRQLGQAAGSARSSR
jgi:hypothetical protein